MKKIRLLVPILLLTILTNACLKKEPPKEDVFRKEAEFSKALSTYINGNFGVKGLETSWYWDIRGYTVDIGGSQTVVTVITDLPEGDTKIANMASAFLGFLNSNTTDKRYQADTLLVTQNGTGKVLYSKETIGSD